MENKGVQENGRFPAPLWLIWLVRRECGRFFNGRFNVSYLGRIKIIFLQAGENYEG